MSGNTWWSIKFGAKMAAWFSYIFNIFFWHSIRFPRVIRAVPLKYLMYFLAGINTKQVWKVIEEKYFAPLRILNLFIKSFVNHFVDIALTFFDSSFDSFLFEVTFLFKFFSSSTKSFLFVKLAISFFLAEFACVILQ